MLEFLKIRPSSKLHFLLGSSSMSRFQFPFLYTEKINETFISDLSNRTFCNIGSVPEYVPSTMAAMLDKSFSFPYCAWVKNFNIHSITCKDMLLLVLASYAKYTNLFILQMSQPVFLPLQVFEHFLREAFLDFYYYINYLNHFQEIWANSCDSLIKFWLPKTQTDAFAFCRCSVHHFISSA